MTHTETRRTTAYGPVVGVAGTGQGGPLVGITCPKEKYVGTVSVRVRSRLLSARIQRGSVLVEVAIRSGRALAGAVSDAGDPLDDFPADWARSSYVFTGHGAAWHPNIFIGPEDQYEVVARVWNRDDLDATRRIIVDFTVTFSARPVAGSDAEWTGFEPGTGTRREITGTNPAANVELSDGLPVGVVWRWVRTRVDLVTDANAANRHVHLDVGGSKGGAQATQPASTTYTYIAVPGTSSTVISANAVRIPVGTEHTYLTSDTIISDTALRQAGDNFGAPVHEVEEWVVPGLAAA